MTSNFSAQDIDSFVSAFPPPISHAGRSSLTWSNSEGNLISIDKAITYIRHLLSKERSRIELKLLDAILHADTETRVSELTQAQIPLTLDRNGRYVIPDPEADSIYAGLVGQAGSQVVDLDGYADDRDIAVQSLKNLVAKQSNSGLIWIRNSEDEQHSYICGETLLDSINNSVRSIVESAEASSSVNLTTAIEEEIPVAALKRIAQTYARVKDESIEIRNDALIYSTPAPAEIQNTLSPRTRSEMINDFVSSVSSKSFCFIAPSDVKTALPSSQSDPHGLHRDCELAAEAVVSECIRKDSPSTPLTTIYVDRRIAPRQGVEGDFAGILVVESTFLQMQLNLITAHVLTVAEHEYYSHGYNAPDNETILEVSIGRYPDPRIIAHILNSSHAIDISAEVSKKIGDLLLSTDSLTYAIVDSKLAVPLSLYTAGIDTISNDDVLRSHLEETLLSHVRTNLIPSTRRILQNPLPNLGRPSLLSDKVRLREFQRFERASVEARSLSAFRSSLTRSLQKLIKSDLKATKQLYLSEIGRTSQSIPRTTHMSGCEADVSKEVMIMILKDSCNAVTEKAARPSDILQHLIWALLVKQRCENPVLFVSSGKDTSRMLRQYVNGYDRTSSALGNPSRSAENDAENGKHKSAGDEAMTEKLTAWRDKIKADNCTENDLSEIRRLVRETVREVEGLVSGRVSGA